MVIEKQAGHIAFQLEKEESIFELGYKVLLKQQINHTLSGIRVQYNLKDRMMYDIENLHTLEDCFDFLDREAAMHVLISLLQVIRDVDNNGFIMPEALQVSPKYIFWSQDEKKAFFIVLPIAAEFETKDHRSWHKKLMDTIHDLVEKTDGKTAEMVTEYLNRAGRLTDQTNLLLQMLVQQGGFPTEQAESAQTAEQCELRLVHQGMYGQITLVDQKKEYVIGKRRDSVDGFLGVSDTVSRIHCKIVKRQNQFFITDLGSSNHTYVNSTMVYPQQEKELFDGSRVRIADIDFTVRITR